MRPLLRLRSGLGLGLGPVVGLALPRTGKRCIASSGIAVPPVDRNGQTTATKTTPPVPLYPVPRRPVSFAGRSAIVTGGSRGIGWAIACRLALEGVSCTLVGRDEAALQRAVEALPRPAPGPSIGIGSIPSVPGVTAGSDVKHWHMAGDVRESSLWGALFANTADVHFLVNAAGVSQSTLLARMSPADIRDVLDVNLYGTISGCRSAMRAWLKKRSKDRCILNIASLLAVRGGYGATVYAASKAGVVGLTRALAEEGAGRRIRANVILPGYINTDMIANMSERQVADMKTRIPMGRFGTPDEVADAAIFLAKNSYANNCVLNLDGGLSAAS
ncbi:3-oxoacyl-acyl carrier protein reductase [Grosmannia clavigera kw1407]|uniref:3-oxoacyl-acyl carrier protein reductase n=1 Tax=Grosmannia clavigera (strain kw1407 / UAMH 11150) TaxID=655863 RepID=F0X7K8_GROCL|nr:3-oxoacyl-acyl carrier protein reductase [Grosmannia clavigera kw1407]EFX06582.1 3-oxoacyl-acyl carrier protein reductase [Grosmannia clavigera kw1407]